MYPLSEDIYSRIVQESLRRAVDRIRLEGRVPMGILSYDPRSDELGISLCDDIQDMAEANAILAKFNLAVIEKEKDK